MKARALPVLLLAAAFLAPALPDWAEGAKAYVLEEGVASWYGKQFHGNPTASGEKFDKDGMTAAHRTLPFGTMLLVTNLDNGKQARLRVNDRGPFVKDRILDCAEGGAVALGFRLQGTTRVRLEVLGALPNPDDPKLSKKERKKLRKEIEQARRRGRTLPDDVLVPVDAERGPFLVQVGAFSVKDNAERLAGKLRDQGFEARVVLLPDGLHRVRVGPYADRAAADDAARKLQDAGQATFLVRDDDSVP